MEIINVKFLHIITILGGFHLLMSYLGSLGTLMKGLGLAHALEEIYGTNTVKHVMSGKVITRPLKAHVLVGSALTAKLLKQVIPSEEQPESTQSKLSISKMEEVEALLNKVYSRPISAKTRIEQSNALCILDEKFKDVINNL